jgi:hypothetical protein
MLDRRTIALTLGLALSGATPAWAQIDYRNLDDDRPTLTEDAYPVEHHAFELLLPYRLERERTGGRAHVLVPELTYGIAPNLHVGLKVPVAGVRTRAGGETRWGLAGVRVFGLYNFNTEGRLLPALSLRTDAALPVGSLAGDGVRLTVKGIATRSWGLTRVHLNAARSFGGAETLSAVEPGPRWVYGLAVDRTLFRQSALLVAEIYVRRTVAGERAEANGTLGARYQWTPTTVIDLGISHRLRDDAGSIHAVTFGFTHAFAVRALMPGGAR